jgi:hypothetical protein
MILIASPGRSTRSVKLPAATSPTTGSSTGTRSVSAACTAYPSTALLSNGGTRSPATTSSASTRPSASKKSTTMGASGGHAAMTVA